MKKQERLAILKQALASGDSWDFSIADYKAALEAAGYEGGLSDRTLYHDIQGMKADRQVLETRIWYLAFQNDNLNVALGAVNRLLDLKAKPFDVDAAMKSIDQRKRDGEVNHE